MRNQDIYPCNGAVRKCNKDVLPCIIIALYSLITNNFILTNIKFQKICYFCIRITRFI